MEEEKKPSDWQDSNPRPHDLPLLYNRGPCPLRFLSDTSSAHLADEVQERVKILDSPQTLLMLLY